MIYSARHRRNTHVFMGAIAISLLFATPHKSFAANTSGESVLTQGRDDTIVVKPPIIKKDPPPKPKK